MMWADYGLWNDFGGGESLAAGALLHFWTPPINEKIFIKTGLSRIYLLSYDEGYKFFFKIPFHVEYWYPRGIIKPRISYGLNFYTPPFTTSSLCAGAVMNVYKSLSVSLNAEAEFQQAFAIPVVYRSYSVFIGVMVCF